MVALSVVSCGSDATDPPRPSEELLAYRLESPHPVGAAVLHVTGITSATVDGGEAFLRERGGATYLVLVLYEPGDVHVRVAPADGVDQPTFTVLELSGEDDEVAEVLDVYRVVADE